MATRIDLLDRLLDPVSRAMGTDALKALVSLRADASAQNRIEELADKCTEDQLTDEEREEYEALVAAASVIAVLQAKARSVLSGSSAA